MRKIRIIEVGLDNGAGSKGQFYLNDKKRKINVVHDEDFATGNTSCVNLNKVNSKKKQYD